MYRSQCARHFKSVLTLLFLFLAAGILAAQPGGTIRGTVTLATNGEPVHRATVMLVELSRVAETDEQGYYIFEEVPEGVYDILSYLAIVSAPGQLIEVSAGQTLVVDFELSISPLKHEITVTARQRQETTFETVQSVTTVDSFEMAESMASSIGEVLEGKAGVAKRSFGPGSARPVVRGFDGDRVLVVQDGVRLGSLGSQSGDHAEPIDATNVERLEVVKGPATLLYGSNAVGGVVNAVTGHQDYHREPHEGLRGQVSSVAGSNGGQAGASANAEFGRDKWLFWGGGGGQRSGDYTTPLGEVENSKTRINNARAGVGWFDDKGFASLGYALSDGRFGVPFADVLGDPEEEEEFPVIDQDFHWNNVRFSGGFSNIESIVEDFRLILSYTDWQHDELEILGGGIEEVGTTFHNDQFVYRGVFEQQSAGPLSGSFGFWGLHRQYDVVGEEALSPPVDQNAFALFALEELNFDRVKLQLGARVEHTSYQPKGLVLRGEEGEEELVALPERNFTGFSGGAGIRVGLWENGAFVANYTGSYRAPALEELYNFGPHLGLLSFEIGDPNLKRERSNGLDLSLRHSSDRLQGEANFFYYDINDFVFLAPTGEVVDGLVEGVYSQGDSRFVGTELTLDVALQESVWLFFGFDWVDAQLTETGTPLPRIPPLRARIGLDLRRGGLSVRPEVVLTDRQDQLFPTETQTAGSTVVNLKTSYMLPRKHFAHHFSANVFNLGDRLYRNHLSFIKELAPEMGRGVRFSYVVKFF